MKIIPTLKFLNFLPIYITPGLKKNRFKSHFGRAGSLKLGVLKIP